MMGTNLLEAVQVRNLIEHMIRSDGVPEARARDWRGQFAEREAIEKWRREAVSCYMMGMVDGCAWLHWRSESSMH